MNVIGLSLLFWLIWFVIVFVHIQDVPLSIFLPFILIYIIGGVILYIGVLFLFVYIPAQRYKALEKEREALLTREENEMKFSRAKALKEKYRYKKLDVKGIIADTGIDHLDKLILLEVLYGYTPDKALELLKDKAA